MANLHLVKIKLDGDLRMMEIPTPPRFDVLVKATIEAYSIVETEGLVFTYTDSDGDQVRFDTDEELNLALRTSPNPLKIVVQRPRKKQRHGDTPTREATSATSPVPLREIPSTEGYAVAANVGSAADDNEEADMVMVDLPAEANASSESHHNRTVADGRQSETEVEIDAQAAFEAEAAAARDPEDSILYQKASTALATRYGVHLTPTQLWRVMALFQLQGRKLVVKGLAPPRALDMSAESIGAGATSGEDEGTPSENMSCDGKGVYVCRQRVLVASPIQRLLELNGVQMPEEEVGPMLQALDVRPRRLNTLGLLSKEEVAELFGRESRSIGGGGVPFGHHIHGDRFRGGGRGGRGRGHGPGGWGSGPPPPHHHHMYMHRPGMMGGPEEGGHNHPPHMHPPIHGGEAHGQGPPPHIGGMHRFCGPKHGHGHPHPHHGASSHGNDADGEKYWHGHLGHPWGVPHPGYPRVPRPLGHFHPGYGFGGRGGEVWGGGPKHGGPCGPGGCGRGGGRGGRESMAMVRFVEHCSPSRGSDVNQVTSGESFKKSWLVRNDSSAPWPEAVSLVPVSRSCQDLSSPPEAAVVGAVAPGEEAELAVDLVAPQQAGMYEGFWRASGGGRRFGQRLWAKVLVVAPEVAGKSTGDDVNAGVKRLSLDDGHKES